MRCLLPLPVTVSVATWLETCVLFPGAGTSPRFNASADEHERLAAAFDPEEGRTICVPTFGGKQGNPVLWGAEWFPEMRKLKGDVGAKHLIGEHADAVCEVPMPDEATLRDIDTPEEMALRRAK